MTLKVGNLQKRLVGHWPLDDVYTSGGKTKDLTPHRNHGTLNGGVTTGVAGKINEAFDFDGSDDYIEVPHDVSIDFNNESFSFLCWFKTDTVQDNKRILTKNDSPNQGYLSLVTNTPSVGLWIEDTDGDNVGPTYGFDYSDNKWHHVAVVFNKNDNTVYLYVDGEQRNTGDISNIEDLTSSQPFVIGAESDASNNFNGFIDDVRIYNRALSESEIKQLCNLRQRGRIVV